MQAPFYYAVTLHQDANVSSDLAPWIPTLPLKPTIRTAILVENVGGDVQGFYVYNGRQWVFAMPMTEVSASIIRGDTISVYYNDTMDTTAPAGSTVYKNGILQPDLDITAGTSVWVARTPPAGGGGSGSVVSVNGQTGAVIINATNLPGLSTVGKTGNYSDLIGAPQPYMLTVANATTLGGVMVPANSGIDIDASGNIDLSAAVTANINSKFGLATAAGSGTSLINAQSGGVLNLKTIKAGTNTTITDDGQNGLVINSTSAPLTAATTTTLGGVIVPSGSAISVAADGSIDLSTATVQAINSKLTAVVGNATGTESLVKSTVGSVVTLKNIHAGANISILDDGNGTLTISGSGGTLPIASASTLGGIKVGTGLSIAGDGTLSANTTNLTVSGDASGTSSGGTLTLTLAPSGVTVGTYTKVTVDAKGRVTAGAALASSDVTNALGFTPYSTANPAGYITANQNIAITGDATGTGATSIALTLSNSGVTAGTYTKVTVDVKGRVTAGAQLAASDVNIALGYTAYDGVTNSQGFLKANQTITVSGDATGTGTNAIALTLANSGATAGTYKSVTVDAKGRVTAGTNPTTLAGYGITNAVANTGGSVTGTITLSSGATIAGVPTPSANTDAANKIYVDNAVAALATGTSWKLNADVASTANIASLSGLAAIDGYTPVAGNRILVKDQTDQTQNGVWVAASGAWTRALDLDTGAEIKGSALLVLNGTTQALSQWVNTNTSTPTVGTDPITYAMLQGAGQTYTAGTGLALTGNVFSIANTGVTTGTYSKLTVNAQGQVTAGAQLANSDITAALGFTPYNATNPSNYISANQTISVTGDATGSGATAIALTLANSGVTAGTYKSVTVDAKGRVTNGSNPTTLAGYGITDGLSGTGGSVTGTITLSGAGLITGVPVPTNASDATNKSYTDSLVTATFNGVAWKTVVAAASTTNISAAGGLVVVDGYQTQAGDRILVKDQSDQTSNGIWIAASGGWTRAADSTTGAQLKNQIVMVLGGTTQARTQWLNTNTGTITVNSTPVTYAQTGSASQTLTLTGDVTGSGSGSVATTLANSGVTAGTYTKVTVDAKGRVTTGAQLAAADVTTALTYTPLNKAGDSMTGLLKTVFSNITGASTLPVSTVAANSLNVLGSNTINGFDSSTVGDIRDLVFQGVNVLVHTAGAFILPTSANITTAIGDTARFICIGGANWQCLAYMRVNGQSIATPLDTTKLPLAGGTMTGALNLANAVTLASAATVNIGAAASNTINVTGTTAITAFDTIAAGAYRRVVFAASLTLTHNATSLILPGAANITTAAGDSALMLSLGGGNWRCVQYQKADGTPVVGGQSYTAGAGLTLTGGAFSITSADLLAIAALSGTSGILSKTAAGAWSLGPTNASNAINEATPVTLASATTVNIGAAAANTINVSGTTTIAAFDSAVAGARRTVVFQGALQLTYNATSMILPTAANITTAAGDAAEFVSLGSGNWRCVQYQKADGSALLGGGAASPFTTQQVFNGSATVTAMAVKNITELGNIIAGVPAATQNIDVSNGALTIYTGNATNNWTFNFRHSSTASLTSAMAVGDSITVTVVTTQSTTAYYPTAFQIDGAAVTPQWQGGVTPVAGNVGSSDVYTFTIIKVGATTFRVLASQAQYK